MPSRGATRIVARDRLLAQLLEARRKRCVVLQGPVGSGKTTALVAWRESLLLLGFGVAWQTFAPDDNDLTLCLDRLIASLAQVDPEITREAALLVERGMDDEAVERIAIALVRGIANHPADITLILDDLHHLANTRNHEALQWLLDFAPGNLHVVLVSRASIPLSLGRLRDQGLVLELDMRDLRFTAAESEEFLRAQLGDISPREARRLHDLTDGWVAGLQLFAIRLKRKSQDAAANESTRTYLLDAQAFEEYFEREVLSRLSAPEVELLIRMAACTRLCAPLCIALAGNVQQPAEVLSLLEKLESDKVFIMPIVGTGSPTWYRLNPLFRETLLERFRARSESFQREIHLAAWIWFRDHDQPDDAVRHALLAQEPAAAIELVQKVARTMRIAGQFRKLAGLMRLLPAAEVQQRIDLRLWMTMLHLYAGERDACAAEIERLQADIPDDDPCARYKLTLLQASLAVQRDDTDAVARLLPALLRMPAEADGLMIGARNNLLTWLYAHQGEYEQARSVQAESPRLLVDGAPLMGTSAGMLNGRCLVGFSYALEGKFIQAERIYRDVLFEANQHGSAASESSCLASALLGEVLYEFNELDAARRLLEDRIDVLERVSIPDSVLRLFTTLSAIHWMAGRREDAFACLKRLEGHALQHQLERLLAHSVAEQVHRHLLCGQLDAAEAGLARLDDLASRAAAAQSVASAEIQLSADRSHVNWCIANGDSEDAAARLDILISRCEERGWQRQLAQFQVQAALIASRRGRADAARTMVLDALRRGNRLGLLRSLLDADPAALDLIVQVMQGEPHDPILSFYLNRLQSAQPAASAVRATSASPGGNVLMLPGAEALSEREAKVVSLLAKALPNKKIARTLGISPETVKWHLKNIYGKLGVSSRDEAVARVRDLKLGSDADADEDME